jgi:hypothetical protein
MECKNGVNIVNVVNVKRRFRYGGDCMCALALQLPVVAAT